MHAHTDNEYDFDACTLFQTASLPLHPHPHHCYGYCYCYGYGYCYFVMIYFEEKVINE